MRLAGLMLVAALSLGLFAVGCQNGGGTADVQQLEQAKCPVCGKAMDEGEYCETCSAVATSMRGRVHCDECGEDHKIGTYCQKCNCFVFPEDDRVRLASGTYRSRGFYDERLQTYAGLPYVSYCPQCQKPHKAGVMCSHCGASADN